MLGHELRNPLAPLRVTVETLRQHQPVSPELERSYALMERQVEHLSRLVDDLLDLSRITRGLVELHKGPVSRAEDDGLARQATALTLWKTARRRQECGVAR